VLREPRPGEAEEIDDAIVTGRPVVGHAGAGTAVGLAADAGSAGKLGADAGTAVGLAADAGAAAHAPAAETAPWPEG
jgi:hypothetical protein